MRIWVDGDACPVVVKANGHYAERSMVAGCQVQHDPSRKGHAWRLVDMTAARMADAAEEIAAEIIDGRNTSCSSFVSTSGDHFRWEEWSQ